MFALSGIIRIYGAQLRTSGGFAAVPHDAVGSCQLFWLEISDQLSFYATTYKASLGLVHVRSGVCAITVREMMLN